MATALLLDDDPEALEALNVLVQRHGLRTVTATTLAEAAAKLEAEQPELIISDLMLPDGQGLELLDAIEPPYDPELILVTGHASVETAVEALRLGVGDYLTKPIDLNRLQVVLKNFTRTLDLKREIGSLRSELRDLGHFGKLVGTSPDMNAVFDLIARVAPRDASVLVTGESGTGKELVASTIHALSRRRDEEYIALNCGAVSASLIESELFGHERGSFTGAERLHRGHFERASGGTLFLDEVTEMPIELQAKLLRVLESGKLTRVGGETPIAIDVRIVAATNRSPDEAVSEGKLRSDLLYRLNVFPIELPPLRKRGRDIELLALHFLDALNAQSSSETRFGNRAVDALLAYEWPGNVRELANVIHRAHILADDEIGPEHLPTQLVASSTARPAGGDPRKTVRVPLGAPLADIEKTVVIATLKLFDGDKQKTADTLGISLKTLYNRLKLYSSDAD